MMMEILIPVLTLSILGFIFGLGLAYALKIFSVKKDPRIEQILSILPGANCGACGFVGCLGLAEALAEGKVEVESCLPGGQEVYKGVAQVLGHQAKDKVKLVAALICNGGKNALDKYEYRGIKTCQAANLYFAGQKACNFACLEFGDCVRACPFGAIKMEENSLPVIDLNLCTGCQKCVVICPKNVLTMVPLANKVYVKCNSKDKGPSVVKVCKSGCIACGKCVKVCEFDAIKVENNLAKIDYNKCTSCGACVKVCPTEVILVRG